MYITWPISSPHTHLRNIYWFPLMDQNKNWECTYWHCTNFHRDNKKVFKNLVTVLEANIIYSSFLSFINIMKWWLSSLFLTREIEFHELLTRLIFLRKEHSSDFSVDSFFPILLCSCIFARRRDVDLGRFKDVNIFIITQPQYIK